MIRLPLASASLLAIAISLAGCGDKDQEKTQQLQPLPPQRLRQHRRLTSAR